MENLTRQLLEFLDASPSCYHATENLVKALTAAGYHQLWEAEPWTLAEGGRLADIAPTILAVMGPEQPKVMPGRSLIQ